MLQIRLLKALKEDLSDSDCNITENALYTAVNGDGQNGKRL
jgi:hypothetical protein